MKTAHALLLPLPTERCRQGFPAAGCRPRTRAAPGGSRDGGRPWSSSSQPPIYPAHQATASKFSSPSNTLFGGSVNFPAAAGCQRADGSPGGRPRLPTPPRQRSVRVWPCPSRSPLLRGARWSSLGITKKTRGATRTRPSRSLRRGGLEPRNADGDFRRAARFCVVRAQGELPPRSPLPKRAQESSGAVASAHQFNISLCFSPQSQHPEQNHLAINSAFKREGSF